MVKRGNKWHLSYVHDDYNTNITGSGTSYKVKGGGEKPSYIVYPESVKTSK